MARKRRMKTRKKKSALLFGYDKRLVYSLLFGIFLVSLVGGSTLLSAFGYESVWGADVQFNLIRFNDIEYENPESLPFYAFNVGSRTISADFDLKPIDAIDWDDPETRPDFYWPDALGRSTVAMDVDVPGMAPLVNYDIGRFKYYNNLSEEIAAATGYPVIHDNNTGDFHFYFGFSVGFSTSAYSIPATQIAEVASGYCFFVPEDGLAYAWYGESFVESKEVNLVSEIALRFAPVTEGDFVYYGTLNSIAVFRERAYYVTRPPGTDFETIDEFNREFGWTSEDFHLEGYARGLGTPAIVYDIINSTTEDMATISVGATLRPALDPVVHNVVNDPKHGFSGYLTVGAIDVYNVGYIYDIIVDVSINGIPLDDPSAEWLSGRYGLTFPSVEPLPWWYSDIWFVVIGLVIFIVAAQMFGRRGG